LYYNRYIRLLFNFSYSLYCTSKALNLFIVLRKLVKRVLVDQKVRLERKFERERIVERDVPDLRKYLNHPNVLAILGVRRSGKSTLAEMLLRNENFAYVNFDDDRLAGIKVEDLHKLEKAIYELFGDVNYFLFDEIHNVEGWELFVNRLREDGKRVIITGSNSKTLSGELSTALTGRHTDFTLFPFSFSEYLRFKGVKIEEMGGVLPRRTQSAELMELRELPRNYPPTNYPGGCSLRSIRSVGSVATWSASRIGLP